MPTRPVNDTRRRTARWVAAPLAALCLTGALAACGGGSDSAEAPAAAPPPALAELPDAPAQPVAVGDTVDPGADTPAKVRAALDKSRDVVVIAFVLGGVADDERVAAAVEQASKGAPGRGARFFTYRVTGDRAGFGDLPDILQVDGTPAVAVIGRDRKLANLFTGLVDADIVRQAVASAKESQPAPMAGERAGG